jgi:hypothetical protein
MTVTTGGGSVDDKVVIGKGRIILSIGNGNLLMPSVIPKIVIAGTLMASNTMR